ncbi:hypothetical protein AAU57_08880 [Nonlabens sp. YIK11]|uniref:helix-turn-helix domain-containing protein n=1 Tax=Nonlabens sp. YIK11 TaxID=1453349 RepID=UPI0006DD0AEB|nr:helix-turn-helix domain-containing protein [Nonlabens sp. YIK11]KQC33417.1 hypothetical protein AAU57_08880 [Nonlabens sp. YIK11]
MKKENTSNKTSFIQLHIDVLSRTDITLTEKILISIITSYQRNGDKCYHSIDDFKDKIGVSKRTIIKSLKNLETKGIIQRDKFKNLGITKNQYLNRKGTIYIEKGVTPTRTKIKSKGADYTPTIKPKSAESAPTVVNTLPTEKEITSKIIKKKNMIDSKTLRTYRASLTDAQLDKYDADIIELANKGASLEEIKSIVGDVVPMENIKPVELPYVSTPAVEQYKAEQEIVKLQNEVNQEQLVKDEAFKFFMKVAAESKYFNEANDAVINKLANWINQQVELKNIAVGEFRIDNRMIQGDRSNYETISKLKQFIKEEKKTTTTKEILEPLTTVKDDLKPSAQASVAALPITDEVLDGKPSKSIEDTREDILEEFLNS